ncbi:class I SAM-dependent methyltransferase [Pedobacter insulae]|nr:class I SAM-dependent methyltransferase [Pedobacter insulae]
MPEISWDNKLYDKQHHFVSDYGADVVQWLAPKNDEHILDVGCGTGQLAAQIAKTGALVLGTDASENMVEIARINYPALKFEVIDGTKLPYKEEFDAIFSNATFHWIDNQEELTKRLFSSLKIGGRLVAEFGAKGNVKKITDAVKLAAKNLGLDSKLTTDFWFFPTISTYTTLLEKNGFEVEQAWLFDRPTPLKGINGMRDWITQFAPYAFKNMNTEEIDAVKDFAVEILKPSQYKNDQWIADYKRLRVKAYKN